MQRLVMVVVATYLCGISTSSTTAALITSLEFNVDGILPSSESDISFVNNTGVSESSLYSVSGGFLRQRTLPGDVEVVGSAFYSFPNSAVTGGGLSPTLSTILETEVNVLDLTSSVVGSSGAFFQAFDGANRYLAVLTPSGVDVLSSSGHVSVPFDVLGSHTYRIESPANSNEGRLFIDGIFRQSWIAAESSLNGFSFGDPTSPSGNAANADWNYIRLSQNEGLSAVPEPSSIAMLGLFLIGPGVRGWRRRRKAA